MRTLLYALVDYAGLFPPASFSMRDAVTEYITARQSPYAWMLGRFIVPLSRAAEFAEQAPSRQSIELSVILDTGITDVAHLARFTGAHSVKAVELTLKPDQFAVFEEERARGALRAIPAYVEFSRDGLWEQRVAAMMPALRDAGAGAKVRCGGLNASAFPSAHDLAIFIEAACREGIPFKATAGLHHPFPTPDPVTGAMMHGFINVLVCTALARRGASLPRLVAALECADVSAFGFGDDSVTFDAQSIDLESIAAMRQQSFVAYGSCSFSEPVEDLRALRLL